MNRILIVLLLLVPQETLQVKVSLVTVGVRVTDSRGRNVLGLKAQHFAIEDDGVPQKIEFFSNEEQPITMGILLDRSFSMSYNGKLERAKEAARTLIRATHDGSEYFYVAVRRSSEARGGFHNRSRAGPICYSTNRTRRWNKSVRCHR